MSKPQKLTEFNSTNVKSAMYDPTKNELTVRFNSGGSYRYGKVGDKTWRAFQSAKSKGGFVASKLVKRKNVERL
jgi:hypothetical protein